MSALSKIVFAGDSLLTGENGFYPLIEARILLENPSTDLLLEGINKNCETYAQIFDKASATIIGRAPETLFLSLGINDIYSSLEAPEILQQAHRCIELLKDKTAATILLTNVPSALLRSDNYSGKCENYNAGLKTICDNLQINLLDINRSLDTFLENHRKGSGEKRPLHKSGPELYPMGQLLLADLTHEYLKERIKF